MNGPGSNNNPQGPTNTTNSNTSGGSVQIDMDSGHQGRGAAAQDSSSSDSFGVLRGRLIDGIRRVMLPAMPSTSSSSSATVFRQNSSSSDGQPLDLSSIRRDILNHHPVGNTSPAVLAHHRYAPLNNNNNNSGVGITTTNGIHNQMPTTTTVQSFNHNHNSPRSPNAPFPLLAPETGPNNNYNNYSPNNNNNNINNGVGLGIDPDEEEGRIRGGGGVPTGNVNPPDDNQHNVESFTDAMAQHPELRGIVIAVLKTLPFVGIIVLKVAYDHLNSLINLAFLGGIFLHTNVHLKREISKKTQRSAKKLIFHVLVIAFGLLIKWADDTYILDILTMMSYRTINAAEVLLYYLLMADLCVKCITVAVKTVITLLPESVVEFKGRGRIYLLVEAVSQFYRCFLPVQPWAAYLLNNYEGYDKVFGTLLVVAYVFWKFREVLCAGKFLHESYVKFKQNSNFGTTPTSDELNAVGNQCPICHESFSCPIALECGHIFCDLCIGVWFDRETTCPMCRKKITDDPRYRDGGTSLFVQVA